MEPMSSPEVADDCGTADEIALPLVAYCVDPAARMPIVPASINRAWMDATDRRFANRCLPLLIGNQAGWFLLSAHKVALTWSGAATLDGVRIEYLAGEAPFPCHSHFGSGIVTWTIPYLFRTPPGFNLQVRGPSNWPKDGIFALEGLVETDWAQATFTMNWIMTRPHQTVVFDVGEPIAMIVPQPRAEIEAFRPTIKDIVSDPKLYDAYSRWNQSRAGFNAELREAGPIALKEGWQKHYARGVGVGESKTDQKSRWAIEHQTRLHLTAFADERTTSAPPAHVEPTSRSNSGVER